MAHPTIDLTQSPDVNCFHPAYNCVKFCFQCNDYITAVGTKAQFTIKLNPLVNGYPASDSWVIAGQKYGTTSVNSYRTINTIAPQTAAQFAANVKEALERNNLLYFLYSISIVADEVVAIARQVGEIDEFLFDYSDSTDPPVNSDTNGTNNEYRNNYRLVVEIWDTKGAFLISKDSYTPDPNGAFCINIGEKIAPLLETTFPHLNFPAFSGFYEDVNFSKSIFIRYGELYSDDIEECDVELRDFENSDSVIVTNSAFQREYQQDKYTQMCDREFLTSTPDFAPLCRNSVVFIWINVQDILESLGPGEVARPYYEWVYTDGTTDNRIGSQFPLIPFTASDGFVAVYASVSAFGPGLDPNKQLDYWRVRIVVRTDNNPATDVFYASSNYFKLENCCEGDVDFYFLNEFGGIDTMLMNKVTNVELNQSFATTESFIDCEKNEALESGVDVLNQEAFDVFTVTSKFTNDYETRLWLRQAIMSPKKWIRATIEGQDDIFYKVIALDTSTIYYNQTDNFLYLTLQYRINETLNVQKN